MLRLMVGILETRGQDVRAIHEHKVLVYVILLVDGRLEGITRKGTV